MRAEAGWPADRSLITTCSAFSWLWPLLSLCVKFLFLESQVMALDAWQHTEAGGSEPAIAQYGLMDSRPELGTDFQQTLPLAGVLSGSNPIIRIFYLQFWFCVCCIIV